MVSAQGRDSRRDNGRRTSPMQRIFFIRALHRHCELGSNFHNPRPTRNGMYFVIFPESPKKTIYVPSINKTNC
jgi:hypothetical protein